MISEPLVPVPFVFLSIMGPTGYVRVNIFASKVEFELSTWQKRGILVENFLRYVQNVWKMTEDRVKLFKNLYITINGSFDASRPVLEY